MTRGWLTGPSGSIAWLPGPRGALIGPNGVILSSAVLLGPEGNRLLSDALLGTKGTVGETCDCSVWVSKIGKRFSASLASGSNFGLITCTYAELIS